MSPIKTKSAIMAVICFLIGAVGGVMSSDESMTIGVLHSMGGPGAEAVADPSADDGVRNMIAAHNRNSRQYDKKCTSCHSSVLSEKSLNPGIHTAHVTMRPFVPGQDDDRRCAFCHKTVDLVERSTGNLRKHVDSMLCAVCHGPERPTKQFYLTGPSPGQPDGQLLYTLMCSSCHRDLADSQVRGKSAGEIAKAISVNKGGMKPLGILTSPELQAIANVLGR